jgi:hypothetical protein
VANSAGEAETAELDCARAETAVGTEVKAEAEALLFSRSLSNGRLQRRHGGGEARNGARVRSTRSTLSDDESAAQRDQLISDLAQLQSSDDAADWLCAIFGMYEGVNNPSEREDKIE